MNLCISGGVLFVVLFRICSIVMTFMFHSYSHVRSLLILVRLFSLSCILSSSQPDQVRHIELIRFAMVFCHLSSSSILILCITFILYMIAGINALFVAFIVCFQVKHLSYKCLKCMWINLVFVCFVFL